MNISKNTKKMLSFILATAMIGFTLTACGEKSNGEEEPISSVASAIDTDTELPIDVDKETIDYVKESEEEPVYVDDEDSDSDSDTDTGTDSEKVESKSEKVTSSAPTSSPTGTGGGSGGGGGSPSGGGGDGGGMPSPQNVEKIDFANFHVQDVTDGSDILYCLKDDNMKNYDDFIETTGFTKIEDDKYEGAFKEEMLFKGIGHWTRGEGSTKVYIKTDADNNIVSIVFSEPNTTKDYIYFDNRFRFEERSSKTDVYEKFGNICRVIQENEENYLNQYSDGTTSIIFSYDSDRHDNVKEIMLYIYN